MDAGASSLSSFVSELIAGRYRTQSLLGQGGMGVVHSAIDELTGQHLAIKRTSPGARAKNQELFKREFHTLHGLRHPNIVAVYDYAFVGRSYELQRIELLLRGEEAGAHAVVVEGAPWLGTQPLSGGALALGLAVGGRERAGARQRARAPLRARQSWHR